jgi:hypothetical protein
MRTPIIRGGKLVINGDTHYSSVGEGELWMSPFFLPSPKLWVSPFMSPFMHIYGRWGRGCESIGVAARGKMRCARVLPGLYDAEKGKS